RPLPRAAGFGVAGPVRGGRARITKLPWMVEERRLSSSTGIPRVLVINDFVAAALGVPYVSRGGMRTLRAGEPEARGPRGLIGAGTGLGQAVLLPVRAGWIALASEGGHADFGPRDRVEDRLVARLRREFGRGTRGRPRSGHGLT